MVVLLEVLRWTQLVAFVAVAVWALDRWRRRGDDQSRWLAATFATLAVLGSLSRVLEPLETSRVTEVIGHAAVVLMALFPYLLLRFLDSFEPVPRWSRRGLGFVVVALALASTQLDLEGLEYASWGPAATVTIGGILVVWLTVMPAAAVRFWLAGRGKATLARRRLRLLSVAVVLLGVGLFMVVSARDAEGGLGFQVVALLAAATLLMGFLPPPFLRRLWRQREEHDLHMAAVQLMAAARPEEVAAVVAPHVRSVVGARGVAVVQSGTVLATSGQVDEAWLAAPVVTASRSDGMSVTELTGGAIVVWLDRFTSLFGDEEAGMLERIALLVDLALHRTSLLASETAARQALEHTNAELESFVYSASHDLKSPLIAMLSYADVLDNDLGDSLSDDGRWYLERITANGRYMEALISGLLELSRVGRSLTESDLVDVADLVTGVADELRERHEGLTVHVEALPTLRLNRTRARQVVTNLLENAVKHGGRGRVTVWVGTAADDGAGITLSFRDDGAGVPAPYREQVFGVFERLATDEDAGTGIGLAIVRRIVESVGGRVWLADRDDGAEFLIRFPEAAVAEATARSKEVAT